MSSITDLVTATRTLLLLMANKAKEKPAEATASDDASAVAGVTKTTLLNEQQTSADTHANNKSNPHGLTADALGGVDKPYVNNILNTKTLFSSLNISQYGDSGSDSLQVLASGNLVRFTLQVPAYLAGIYQSMPEVDINLSSLPGGTVANTFYLYVRVVNNALVYVASTEKVNDTNLSMYIGKAITNGTSITSLVVGRVMRLGTARLSSTPSGSSIPFTTGAKNAPAQLASGWRA